MDPFLLAIQVPELVGADVNQGAQVTMISTAEEKGGWVQAQVACVPGLALTTVYPPQGRPCFLIQPPGSSGWDRAQAVDSATLPTRLLTGYVMAANQAL